MFSKERGVKELVSLWGPSTEKMNNVKEPKSITRGNSGKI